MDYMFNIDGEYDARYLDCDVAMAEMAAEDDDDDDYLLVECDCELCYPCAWVLYITTPNYHLKNYSVPIANR